MTESHASRQQLIAEIAALRARLDDAEETLRAIQSGEVDAIVLSGPEGGHIHTLEGAQEPYRVMVEAMSSHRPYLRDWAWRLHWQKLKPSAGYNLIR